MTNKKVYLIIFIIYALMMIISSSYTCNKPIYYPVVTLNIKLYSQIGTENAIEYISKIQYYLNVNNKIGLYIYIIPEILNNIPKIKNPNDIYIIFHRDPIKIQNNTKILILPLSDIYIDNTRHLFFTQAIVCHGCKYINPYHINTVVYYLKNIINIPLSKQTFTKPHTTKLYIPSKDSSMKLIGCMNNTCPYTPTISHNIRIYNPECKFTYTLINFDPTTNNIQSVKYKPFNNNKTECYIIYDNNNNPQYTQYSKYTINGQLNSQNNNHIPIINFNIYFNINIISSNTENDFKLKSLLISVFNYINNNSFNFKINYKFTDDNNYNFKIGFKDLSSNILAVAYGDIFRQNMLAIYFNNKYQINIDTMIHEIFHILGYSHTNMAGIMSANSKSINNINLKNNEIKEYLLINICPLSKYIDKCTIYNTKNEISINISHIPISKDNNNNVYIILNPNPYLYTNLTQYILDYLNKFNMPKYSPKLDEMKNQSSKLIYKYPIYLSINEAFDNNEQNIKYIESDKIKYTEIPVPNVEYLQNHYCSLVIGIEIKKNKYYMNIAQLDGCYMAMETNNNKYIVCCHKGMKISELHPFN